MTVHHKFMRVVDAQERSLKILGYSRSCKKRTVVCAGVIDGKLITLTQNIHKSTCDCHVYFPEPSPNAQHAEVGAIKVGCDTLYITYQPCPDCAAKMIEARTVQAVYYRDQDSKASTESIELLRGAGIYVSNEWLNV
mgnify:CR=1 FL=1